MKIITLALLFNVIQIFVLSWSAVDTSILIYTSLLFWVHFANIFDPHGWDMNTKNIQRSLMLCLLPNRIQIVKAIKYVTILPVSRFTSSTSPGTHFPLTPPLIRLSLSLAGTFPLQFSLAVSWYYFPQHHRCSSSSCLATHTETTLGTALIL